MKRRSMIWLVLALIFTIGNVAGIAWAASMGELRHAMTHVALAIAGAWLTWELIARRRNDDTTVLGSPARASSGELGSRLTHLEQSLDAIALEVERVGEGQRYMTRVYSERERKADQP